MNQCCRAQTSDDHHSARSQDPNSSRTFLRRASRSLLPIQVSSVACASCSHERATDEELRPLVFLSWLIATIRPAAGRLRATFFDWLK